MPLDNAPFARASMRAGCWVKAANKLAEEISINIFFDWEYRLKSFRQNPYKSSISIDPVRPGTRIKNPFLLAVIPGMTRNPEF
jgi:hypothetical protein